jgi:hypothetical protein
MPPSQKHYLLSAEEMAALYARHNFDSILAECRTFKSAVPQTLMHETFCCKKFLVQYRNPKADDEIAFIAEQVFRDPQKGTVRHVLRLRVEGDVYSLKLP